MKVGMRLFRYALYEKKIIVVALLMLMVGAAAELTGPLIAKQLIDTNILGIEKPWYETEANPHAVAYRGKWYTREDRLPSDAKAVREVRILQAGRDYAFVPQPVAFDGKRELRNGRLYVTSGERTADYPAERMSAGDVYRFYEPEVGSLVRKIAFYGVLVALASLLAYGQKYGLQAASNRILRRMRDDVFDQLHRLPVRFFDKHAAGRIVSRVTNDTEAIRDLYVTVLANFFNGLIYVIGIYAAMYWLNARLALICTVLLPLLVVWFTVYRRYAVKYNQVIRARLSDINGMINETIQGMPVIRAFWKQRAVEAEFEALNREHYKYQDKLLVLNSLTQFNLVNLLRNFIFVGILWYAGGRTMAGIGITVGVLYAFVDYINRLFQPIQGVVNQLSLLEQARVAAHRVFEVMDEEGVDPAEGTGRRYRGNVVFRDVTFAYDEEPVLKAISFEARAGETVALVGHTGSGKSSTMNLLFRFYDAQEGAIEIDGRDIREIPKQHLRKHMGIVLQDPFLFTGTIASNVRLNDESIADEEVERALRAVGAGMLIDRLEQGIHEPVLEKGSTLSAGERQLISFARALAFDPAILILDEATANIDTETEQLIQRALDVVKRGRTTFVIAHRLSTIRHADQILVLHRGRIVERGNHDALMEQDGRYRQMYRLQAGADAGMTATV